MSVIPNCVSILSYPTCFPLSLSAFSLFHSTRRGSTPGQPEKPSDNGIAIMLPPPPPQTKQISRDRVPGRGILSLYFTLVFYTCILVQPLHLHSTGVRVRHMHDFSKHRTTVPRIRDCQNTRKTCPLDFPQYVLLRICIPGYLPACRAHSSQDMK